MPGALRRRADAPEEQQQFIIAKTKKSYIRLGKRVKD